MDEEVRTEKIKKAAVKEMDEKKDRCMKALLSLEDELKKTIAAQRSFKIEQAQVIYPYVHIYTLSFEPGNT